MKVNLDATARLESAPASAVPFHAALVRLWRDAEEQRTTSAVEVVPRMNRSRVTAVEFALD
jgi:hypothetical protein